MADYRELALKAAEFFFAIAWLEWARLVFDLLKGVAWPIAVVLCFYLFRERLNEILPRLHLKHKDMEISFQIEQAKEEADRLLPPVSEAVPQSEEQTQKLHQLAAISPKAAILNSWVDLEVTLRDAAAETYGAAFTGPKSRSTTRIIQDLRTMGALSTTVLSIYDELRRVRNKIAHGDEDSAPTYQDALNFASLAERVKTAITAMPSSDELDAAAGIGIYSRPGP